SLLLPPGRAIGSRLARRRRRQRTVPALAAVHDRRLLGAGEMPAGIGLRTLALRTSALRPLLRPRCTLLILGARDDAGVVAGLEVARDRQGAPDQPLYVAQLAALGAVAKCDRDARGAVAPGAAD